MWYQSRTSNPSSSYFFSCRTLPSRAANLSPQETIGDSSGTFKVEPSSPYHINNSDHPGLVIVPKPLNGDNYDMWRRFMTVSLNAKNKLGFVDGTLKKLSSKSDPDEHAMWMRSNDMVFSWIVNTLDPEITDSVIYCTTAGEIWEDLHEQFSQTHSHRNKLMQFLMGLNESYIVVRGPILLMNPLLSVMQAYASISQEEKQHTLGASRALLEPPILLSWLLELDALIRIDPPTTRIVALTCQTKTIPRPLTVMSTACEGFSVA
ncbi:hypothetical protein L3X38_004202 [Prunus dulcis]|uniref:Retrotransposon Copia-like N-terminal domain-containing protein n=1 Tax=Prunus dulcis TaxID=3755 RepID=A0AAD4ZNL1_PRUDU|nr:hypothetical protein L3X38_004202 [Prunus dulcis]